MRVRGAPWNGGGENEKEGENGEKWDEKWDENEKRNEHAIYVLLITTGHLVRSIEVLSILSCNATFGGVEIIPHSTRN